MSTITVIADQSRKAEADIVLDWLQNSKLAELITSDSIVTVLKSTITIPQSSAVILISDEAVANSSWHQAIDNLDKETRIIPIGETSDKVDYSDPNIMPPQIGEVNFIRLDENYLVNVLDSLTTGPAFYVVKNRLQAQAEQWERSGHLSQFFETSVKRVTEDIRIIEQKLATEVDPALQSRLAKISFFLNENLKFSKKLRRQRVRRYSFRVTLLVAAIFFIILARQATESLIRTQYSSVNLSGGVQDTAPDVNAIKIIELIESDFTQSAGIQKYAYKTLISYLYMDWPYTTLGMNHECYPLTTAFSTQSNEILSANMDGTVACWNRESGQTVWHNNVSPFSLSLIATDEEPFFIAVTDIENNLYVKRGDLNSSWMELDSSLGFTSVGLALSSRDNSVLVYGRNKIAIVSVHDGFCSLSAMVEFEEIAVAAQNQEEGVCALVLENNQWQFIKLIDGQQVSSLPIPSEAVESAAMYYDEVLVFLNSHNQLNAWIPGENNSAIPLGLSLQYLVDLEMADSDTLVYADRNAGIRVHNIPSGVDSEVSFYGQRTYVDDISVSGEHIAIVSGGWIMTQNITSLTPLDVVPVDAVELNRDIALIENSSITSLRIESEYLIVMEAEYPETGQVECFVLDPSNRASGVSDERLTELTANLPEGYFRFFDTLSFEGTPVFLGLSSDGTIVTVGSSDGVIQSFTYIDGAIQSVGRKQIPSCLPISNVYYSETCLWAVDSESMVWPVDLPRPYRSIDDLVLAVKEKIHNQYSPDLLSIISPNLAKRLDLEIARGADGELWGYEK